MSIVIALTLLISFVRFFDFDFEEPPAGLGRHRD